MDSTFQPKPNPFSIPHIILTIGNNCKDSKPLRKLRQLNSLHYKILNHKFLDKVDTFITIIPSRLDEYIVKYKSGEKFGPKNIDANDDDNYDLEELGKLEKWKITPANWDPSMAPIIRQLRFRDDISIIYGKERNWPKTNLPQLIDTLVPYVTTLVRKLSIETLPVLLHEIISLTNQFPKVTRIEFRMWAYGEHWGTESFDKLHQLISRPTIKPQIKLDIRSKPLTKCIIGPEGQMQNVQTKIYRLQFSNIRFFQTQNLEEFPNLAPGNNSLSKLSTKLFLEIFPTDQGTENSVPVLNCLNKLSRFVAELWIDDFELDIFSFFSWPMLTEITFENTKVPIQTFAFSPNVQIISMCQVQQESIFQNTEKSDEDNLLQAFGSFKALKKLTFNYFNNETVPKNIDSKISVGNNLHKYLIELLPHTRVIIKY